MVCSSLKCSFHLGFGLGYFWLYSCVTPHIVLPGLLRDQTPVVAVPKTRRRQMSGPGRGRMLQSWRKWNSQTLDSFLARQIVLSEPIHSVHQREPGRRYLALCESDLFDRPNAGQIWADRFNQQPTPCIKTPPAARLSDIVADVEHGVSVSFQLRSAFPPVPTGARTTAAQLLLLIGGLRLPASDSAQRYGSHN